MESISVQAALSVADKGYTSKMERAVGLTEDLGNASQKTGTSIMDIAKGAGAFKVVSLAADTLKQSLSSAVDRFDTLNQYPKVMQNLGYTAEEAGVSLDKLSDGITGLPTALDEAATYTKQWTLSTGDLGKATDLFLAINDGAIAYGASAEQAASCQEQLNQMISTGSYDLQSWKIIQQNCPGMLDAVAQAILGESAAASDLRAALNDGAITTEQFEDTLISLDQNGSESVTAFSQAAQTSSGGISTSVTNMKTAVVRGMEGIIRTTNDALENNGLPGFQGMVENSTGRINTAFSVASGGIELFIGNLDVLVPVLGTATAGFIAYKAAMDVGDKYAKIKSKAAEAAEQIRLYSSANELSAAASLAAAEAEEVAELAAEQETRARKALEEALSAETKAKNLSQEASKAKTAAEKAAATAAKKSADAEKAAEAAAKAKKNTDEKAETALRKKIAAENAAADAAKKSARAEELSAKATEESKRADFLKADAAVLREHADTAATVATTRAATAEEANSTAIKASNASVTVKTALLGVLSGKIGIVEAAQVAWNASMEANPIGTVITAATVLVTVLSGVSSVLAKLCDTEDFVSAKTQKLCEDTDAFLASREESKAAYEEELSSAKASAGAVEKLADKVVALSKVENKSAAQKAELKSYVDQLNGSMEDLNLQYDEENDLLSIGEEALRKKAEAYRTQEESKVYMEQYTKLLEEQEAIEERLNEAKELHRETQKKMDTQLEYSDGALAAYNTELTEQELKIADLERAKEDCANQEKELTDKIKASQEELAESTRNSQQEQQAALAESVANQTVSLDQLSEVNQETVKALSDTWESYLDASTNMFDTLSDEQTLSVDQMIANLQKNQQIVSEMGTNMEGLRTRFDNLHLSQGVLDNLAQMGPEAAGYIAALVTASDEQLEVLAQSYENGAGTAKEGFLNTLSFSDGSLPEAIQNMFMQVETSMRETVEATDWSSLGNEGIDGGVSDGVVDGSSQVITSAINVMTDTRFQAGAAVGEGSPATSFIELGNNMVLGLALGLAENEMAKMAAIRMVQGIEEAVRSSLESADFSATSSRAFAGMENAAQGSMSNIRAAVQNSMSASASAVSAGTTRMQNAMNVGMNSMSTVVKTGMAGVGEQGKTGMSRFNAAIADGMGKAKTSTSSGVSGILSALSPLHSGFYTSGYYASIGLADGINAGAGAAIAAANALATRVAQTMDAALKVGSPSKVTRKTGGFASEGFVLGLLDNLRNARKAAVALAESAVPAGNIAARAAAAGSYTPGGGHDYVGEKDETYTIIVPLDIEGREVARATATYTKEELEKKEKLNRYMKGSRW